MPTCNRSRERIKTISNRGIYNIHRAAHRPPRKQRNVTRASLEGHDCVALDYRDRASYRDRILD